MAKLKKTARPAPDNGGNAASADDDGVDPQDAAAKEDADEDDPAPTDNKATGNIDALTDADAPAKNGDVDGAAPPENNNVALEDSAASLTEAAVAPEDSTAASLTDGAAPPENNNVALEDSAASLTEAAVAPEDSTAASLTDGAAPPENNNDALEDPAASITEAAVAPPGKYSGAITNHLTFYAPTSTRKDESVASSDQESIYSPETSTKGGTVVLADIQKIQPTNTTDVFENDTQSTTSSSSSFRSLLGQNVSGDGAQSVSTIGSPAKQILTKQTTQPVDIFDLENSIIHIDPSMTGCLIARDPETGILYTINTNHNDPKSNTIGELLNRMSGNPTKTIIENHKTGEITTDAMKAFVFCGPKDCLETQVSDTKALDSNYTVITPLAPNYGQEDSKKVIDLYKYVDQSKHIQLARDMLSWGSLKTKELRSRVATYYNMNDWVKKEEELTDKSICQVINEFSNMRWKDGYDFKDIDGNKYNVYFDIMEGRHRVVASVCANENSLYDQERPKIGYGTLTDKYIKQSLIHNNVSKPFATHEWRENIEKSQFNAVQKVTEQVLNGKYGMNVNAEIKFTLHTVQMNSTPTEDSINKGKKEGSQEKLLIHLNEISEQSCLSKQNVSKPTFLETIVRLLTHINKGMLQAKASRSIYNADPGRFNLGDDSELFIPAYTPKMPAVTALRNLANKFTGINEEYIASEYLKLSPNGILANVEEIEEYIKNPSNDTHTKLKKRFTSFVETSQEGRDDLHKDFVQNKEQFDKAKFYRNTYFNTNEERYKNNANIVSSKKYLQGPFVLNYHNLLEGKKSNKAGMLISLYQVNNLLMQPKLHKCCQETSYTNANLKPEQVANRLRYTVKYHSALLSGSNRFETNQMAAVCYNFATKSTMVKEADSVTACTLTLSHAVNAELMNAVDISNLIKNIARSKSNQNIGSGLSDAQVQYTIGLIGIMSNVLSSVITKLIVASIKSAHPKYTPTGPFTQVLTSLICSQTIYDGMQMFGKIGCNPTLNEELVAKHFPDFAIVWKAFYSNTVASPALIKEADEIISKWCPIGRGWSDFNPMLSNGQEVAQHLLTKKALKNNKFLIAMVAFIIYYHEEVSASEDFLAETPLLIGGIVAIQKNNKEIASPKKFDPNDERPIYPSNGQLDVTRFDYGVKPKNLREFGLGNSTTFLSNFKEWMSFLFKDSMDNDNEVDPNVIEKLTDVKIELDLKAKYEQQVEASLRDKSNKKKKKNPTSTGLEQESKGGISNKSSPSSLTKSLTDKKKETQEDIDDEMDEVEQHEQIGGKSVGISTPSGNDKDRSENITPHIKAIDGSAGAGKSISSTEKQASTNNTIGGKKRNNDQVNPQQQNATPKRKLQKGTGVDSTETVPSSNKRSRDGNDPIDTNSAGAQLVGNRHSSRKKQKVDQTTTTEYKVRYNHKENHDVIFIKFAQIYTKGNTIQTADLADPQYRSINDSAETIVLKKAILDQHSLSYDENENIKFAVTVLKIIDETDIDFYNHCLSARHVNKDKYWERNDDGSYTSKKMKPNASAEWERKKTPLEIANYRVKFVVLLDIMQTKGYRYLSEKHEADERNSEQLYLKFLHLKDDIPVSSKDTAEVEELRGGGNDDDLDDEKEFDSEDFSSSDDDDSFDQSRRGSDDDDVSFGGEAEEYKNENTDSSDEEDENEKAEEDDEMEDKSEDENEEEVSKEENEEDNEEAEEDSEMEDKSEDENEEEVSKEENEGEETKEEV